MQSLLSSPLVSWYGKTVNGGGSVTQLRYLLVSSHSFHQVYESTKISREQAGKLRNKVRVMYMYAPYR